MTPDKVQELTAHEFSEFIENPRNKDKLIIADFYAEWCMPCLMMAPIIESLAESNKQVRFIKINTDEAQELAQEFNVSGIPCIIFIKNKVEVDRQVGAVAEDFLDEKIKNNL